MAWSTRELAELAGTTLRAVRHYHQVGLLAEPERRSNGYKQYGVTHLVRLLRIKRLVDLGLTLPQIADLGELDDHPAEALRTLDADLAATIDRLQRARADLCETLDRAAPTDLPPELAPVAGVDLSEADRSFVAVLGRVIGPQRRQAWADMLQDLPDDPVAAEFDDLPAEADEATRHAVTERMVPYVRALRAQHPDLGEPLSDAPRDTHFAARTVGEALRDLYNPAQLDVLRRTEALLRADRATPSG
ncbi:MerR family transcriptional regulator [Pseudonocardia petroleophila]|uniref:MerR family transcriptional regulator n=1 Tax=Pseudonocardia petroleophila TaxID=37331 RepID=A0A7G7MIS5_9PSEU|nr:MerR family transcriptional regulator [Pseudonocardia petroleophila]QNG52686.1 MerR family transcriptional regulator [Pseudonocardia petroleophila]